MQHPPGAPGRIRRIGRLASARPRLVAILLAACLLAAAGCRSRSMLPLRLSDWDFWQLTTTLSEPPGVFDHSDNLVSNEIHIAFMAPGLRPAGGVYVGVGPEQNFTYIAALRPAMAFVADVRVENRSLHLLYKALFEQSADRAEFVFRLFGRERPAGVGAGASVQELFDRLAAAVPRRALREETGRLVRARLAAHRFPLSAGDLEWIEHALDAFHADGPDIHYGRGRPHDSPGPSYRTLMTTPDAFGARASYLGSESAFVAVKDLQEKNLIVPVVADFGSPAALRRIAGYVRQHGEVVSAFYGSNVEVYLNNEKTVIFCANLLAMPYSWSSQFIGARARQPFRSKLEACSSRAR